MIFNLDVINKLSGDKIRKIFLTIPLTENSLEFTGIFYPRYPLEHNRVAEFLHCIPPHVRSIRFQGKYLYVPQVHLSKDVSSMQAGAFTSHSGYVRSLGSFLYDYIPALPDSIAQLSLDFSIDDAYDHGFTKVPADLQRLCNKLKPTIKHLDLNGIATNIHPSKLAGILEHIKFVTHLALEKINFSSGSPEDHESVMRAVKKDLNHLSLAYCNLNRLNTRAFYLLFTGLTPHLKSIDLGNNQLGQKPKELGLFISTLPRDLVSLRLADNSLSNLGGIKLTKLMPRFPKTLTYVDFSDNNLLIMANHILKPILHALHFNVTTLRLCETLPNRLTQLGHLPLNILIERYNECLPPSIDTLDFSRSKLLGRNMVDFAHLINKLSNFITVLDFSDNGFSQTIKEDLICLFSNVPNHIKKIILRRNGLCGMDRFTLKEVLSYLPMGIEIDISDNGLDGLPYTYLNAFTGALPDTLINFGDDRLELDHKGALVASPYQDVKFKSGLWHQTQFVSLQLFLAQLQKKHLNLDILEMLLPFIFHATALDLKRMMTQLIKTNSYIHAKKAPISIIYQQKTLDAIDARIKTLAPEATCLDLSVCALNSLNSEQLSNILSKISPQYTSLKLNSNGFLNSIWSRRNFIIALGKLPQHLQCINFSGNGFEALDDKGLEELFVHFTLQNCKISLNHEEPLTFHDHITQKRGTTEYRELIVGIECPMQQARALLADYTKGSKTERILSGHPNRHHCLEVDTLIQAIDLNIYSRPEDVHHSIESIGKNAHGCLRSRWAFFQNLPSPVANTQEEKYEKSFSYSSGAD
ncbi:MAG: DUF5617 domain-containing protein [Legionella sp.]|nr:DUF5617 domain-containing protein [Legionella sp.]